MFAKNLPGIPVRCRAPVFYFHSKTKFKQYLQHLCEDLSGLLFQEEAGYTIIVEGAKIDIPTGFAIPLGFIVNELITNSAK